MSETVERDVQRRFVVDRDVCIACGASTTVAPGLVELVDGSAVVVAQPRSPEEVRALEDAVALCPVAAISEMPPPAGGP